LKALKDPNNLDAFISAAFLQPLSESMKILEEGARQGEFKEHHDLSKLSTLY